MAEKEDYMISETTNPIAVSIVPPTATVTESVNPIAVSTEPPTSTASATKPSKSVAVPKNHAIPIERLQSQISYDAAPPTPSVDMLTGLDSSICDCSENWVPEFTTHSSASSLPHSKTFPQLCSTCNKPMVSPAHSCTDLSADYDSDGKEDIHSLPDKLKGGCFDVMVLYAESDKEGAYAFLNHLNNEIKLPNGEPVLAVLYDGPELSGLSGLKLEQLDKAFERCSYTFVFLTKNFRKDVWSKLSSESCLMRTVYDKKRNWRVVPVYTKRRSECDFKIPMGFNALKGINYFENDEFYRKHVSNLIAHTVEERNQKEKCLQAKRRNWREIHGVNHGTANDEEIHETVGRTMVQPQQSLETDEIDFSVNQKTTSPSSLIRNNEGLENGPDSERGTDRVDQASFEVGRGPVSSENTLSEIPTTVNIENQNVNSVRVDVNLQCTVFFPNCNGAKQTVETKTTENTVATNACYISQYYAGEKFCANSKYNSNLFWSQQFLNKSSEEFAAYCEYSEQFLNTLD